MTMTDQDTRCAITELYREQCDHCLRPEVREVHFVDDHEGGTRWPGVFTANYPGWCATCVATIAPGEQIASSPDGWVHAECVRSPYLGFDDTDWSATP